MPGYKVYTDFKRSAPVAYPRFGGGGPTSVVVYRKRDGFGHPLPCPPYVKRNLFFALEKELVQVGLLLIGSEFWTNVGDVTLGNYKYTFPVSQSTLNRVYKRFRDDVVGEQSSLGMLAAEWTRSLGMVTNRTLTLFRAGRALYRGRFRDFLHHLGVKPKKKHARTKRTRRQQAANLWLEYSFGWKPLIQTIFTSFGQLEEPIPMGKATGRGTETYLYERWFTRHVGSVKVQQLADIYLTNPNLFLSSQLGLVNPAPVLFDAVPFSFVLDWFFDCQVWLESFSDFVGLSVTNSSITRSYDVFTHETPTYMPIRPTIVRSRYVERQLGLIRPYPNADVLVNIGDSLPRASNAMALLTQLLSKF